MHGGIGMTDEYDAGFYLKRAGPWKPPTATRPSTGSATLASWATKRLGAARRQKKPAAAGFLPEAGEP